MRGRGTGQKQSIRSQNSHSALPAPQRETSVTPGLPSPPLQVHKFGGTCVAAAERIDSICRYLVEGAGAGSAEEQQVRATSCAAQQVVAGSLGALLPFRPARATQQRSWRRRACRALPCQS